MATIANWMRGLYISELAAIPATKETRIYAVQFQTIAVVSYYNSHSSCARRAIRIIEY
jgi:hypothetical protein